MDDLRERPELRLQVVDLVGVGRRERLQRDLAPALSVECAIDDATRASTEDLPTLEPLVGGEGGRNRCGACHGAAG